MFVDWLISHSAWQPVSYCSHILVILPFAVPYLFTVCGDWSIISPLKTSGHYMYRTAVTICTVRFNIHKFHVLPSQYIYVFFVWIWEQTAIISLHSINWLVCITDLTLYGPVVTICTVRFNIHKINVLPTRCIFVFCVDLRTNSDYFPTDWFL